MEVGKPDSIILVNRPHYFVPVNADPRQNALAEGMECNRWSDTVLAEFEA